MLSLAGPVGARGLPRGWVPGRSKVGPAPGAALPPGRPSLRAISPAHGRVSVSLPQAQSGFRGRIAVGKRLKVGRDFRGEPFAALALMDIVKLTACLAECAPEFVIAMCDVQTLTNSRRDPYSIVCAKQCRIVGIDQALGDLAQPAIGEVTNERGAAWPVGAMKT